MMRFQRISGTDGIGALRVSAWLSTTDSFARECANAGARRTRIIRNGTETTPAERQNVLAACG
jgi:hypothetical protein